MLLPLQVIESDLDGSRLAASSTLRGIWQQHVLDTSAYSQACSALCGGLLHHNPDAHDDGKHARRAHRSLAHYRQQFGEDPPKHTWDFGNIGPAPSVDDAEVDEPAAKKARRAAGSTTLHLSVQAPGLPLTQITARGCDSVQTLFNTFVAASGASHLARGRNATPAVTRLRYDGAWLSNDAQTLADAGVEAGAVLFVATPCERRSRSQLSISVKEVGGQKETALIYLDADDRVETVNRLVQDALGVPTDSQQLIFSSQVLKASGTLASARVTDGCVLQLVVGKKPVRQAMSPGGTWRSCKAS